MKVANEDFSDVVVADEVEVADAEDENVEDAVAEDDDVDEAVAVDTGVKEGIDVRKTAICPVDPVPTAGPPTSAIPSFWGVFRIATPPPPNEVSNVGVANIVSRM